MELPGNISSPAAFGDHNATKRFHWELANMNDNHRSLKNEPRELLPSRLVSFLTIVIDGNGRRAVRVGSPAEELREPYPPAVGRCNEAVESSVP